MTRKKITNLYIVSGLTTLGGLLQGFDVASLSAVIGTKQYKKYFHSPDSVTQGGATASMAGGSLVGALCSSWISDKYGRRDTMFVACIIFIIGSALMSAVQNLGMLIASRIINGFAVGMLTSQGPILLAEISLPSMRGRLLAFQQWNITWGILIMYFISYGASFTPGYISFRLPWGLQMIPAIVLMSCLPFMPRSPRWLAGQDRWDEAIQVLADLHAEGDRTDPRVVAEVREIRQKLDSEHATSSHWSELLNSENFIRVKTCIFTHIWAQLTGTNVIQYYIVYIFQMAGITGNDTLLTASIGYVIQVVMTVPALLFMDRWPRRRVMMIGSILLGSWHFAVGGLMASYGHSVPGGLNGVSTVTWVVPNKTASRAIVAFSYMFIATFATTWGPVGWIYPPEIVPFSLRSKVVSLSTSSNWAMNFALTFFTPPAFRNIQWKVYMIFGTFCIAGFIHVFLFFQETRGRSLEEIDDLFKNESKWAFLVDTKKPIQFDIDVEEAQRDIKDTGVAQQVESLPPGEETV